MREKLSMNYAGAALALIIALCSGGCADADTGRNIARGAVAIPVVVGSSIIQGTAQVRAEQSEYEYRKTNPVTSFQDFDQRFTRPSTSPWYP